ncbi:gem-associated protein 2 [Epargyreus clarus]|uniref:gem-associated protein 2 n=1 Tax=Epargyreus clarus TaxID=520877 RepID=UPI003C2AF4AC
MSKKQVLYACNGDDEETEESMSPCFFINPDVELKEVPTNGEEYLRRVIQERKSYSPVSTCTINYSKFAQNQSQFVQQIEHATAPEFLIPTREWQNIQVADFSDVRMYISRLLAKKKLWPKDFKTINFDKDNIALWKGFFENNDPTLTCVLGLKQSLLDKGLEYVIETLDDVEPGQTIDYKTGQWIYAFLACTRQPLLSDTVSILRTLARKCAKIRSHFNDEVENSRINVMPLNLFICLVSRYFRQHDLADPFPAENF